MVFKLKHVTLIHKISILEILDRAFSIYLGNIEIFFPIFLLLNIINAIVINAVNLFMPPFNPPYEPSEKLLNWLINYGAHIIAVLCVLFLISWIMMNLGNSIIIKSVSNILEGRKAGIKNSSTLSLHLFSRVLAVSLITGVLMALGFILLIFPGVIMAVIFSLAVPAVVLENLRVFDGLRKSKELTDKMWIKTFTLLFAFFIIFILANLLTEVLALSLSRFYQQIWIKKIFRIIFFSLVEPIYPIGLTLFYYLLKKQKGMPVLTEAREEVYEMLPPPHPEIKFCYYCGQVLPYDAIYCPNCGRRIKSSL